MPRLALVLVGLAALVTALPSAAQVGSGKIAYTATGGLYTVNPDGSGRTLLTQGADGKYSPDGSKIAYVDGTVSQSRVVVANADGTGEHTVTTAGSSITVGSWSPDGARLAYLLDDKLIYTASAAGGDERRLTFDDGAKSPPVWSPDGLRLAFSNRVRQAPDQDELFVVGADGNGLTQLTHDPANDAAFNRQPAWSPDGSWIAFSREPSGKPSVSVVHPDGSELHDVAYTYPQGGAQPEWSPDGSKIVYTNSINGGVFKEHRGSEIFVVDADGSNEERLTELGPWIVVDRFPTWSPDGARIVFTRNYLPATMNADGTCEGVIANDEPSYYGFSWQAVPGGPALEPKRCHAISVEGDVRVAEGRLTRDSITATVKNEGTEPLSNVELLVAFSHDLGLSAPQDCHVGTSGARCPIGRLERGESRRISFEGLPRRAAEGRWTTVQSRVNLRVVAEEQLLPTRREQAYLRFTARQCSAKDPGSGGILGTKWGERICGRRGADRIFPGPGHDRVDAGAGADVIVAADRLRDWITCGPGRDTVIADHKDVVAPDCERVRRTA